MIVSVVFYGLYQTIGAEAQLILHLLHNLHIYLSQVADRPKALGF